MKESWDWRKARIAGLLYLVVAVCGGFSELYVRSGVVVPGDAGATAENVAASATLFRIGFVSDLVNIACFLLVALVLYSLLKPISQKMAMAMVVFNAVAVAVMGANMLNHLGALVAVTNPSYADAFGAESSQALVLLFLDMHSYGYSIAEVFFGLWLFPLGYLVYRSGRFPRALGALVMAGCFAYLANVAATFASAGLKSELTPAFVVPAALAEVSLIVALLLKGVKLRRRSRDTRTAHPVAAGPTPAAGATP